MGNSKKNASLVFSSSIFNGHKSKEMYNRSLFFIQPDSMSLFILKYDMSVEYFRFS